MQTGTQYGMQTMDQSLESLISSRKILLEEALPYYSKPRELLSTYLR
jgi:Tfp pilus assembly pilus retraction ATPase PilT